MDTVELIARAIASSGNIDPEHWRAYREPAIAAIKALEPMLKPGMLNEIFKGQPGYAELPFVGVGGNLPVVDA